MSWNANSQAIPLPNNTLGAPPTSPGENVPNHEINWPPIDWATDAHIDVTGPPGLGGLELEVQISSPGVGVYHKHCEISQPGRYELPKQVKDVKVICTKGPSVSVTTYLYLVVR